MYKNLEAELKRNNLTRKDIADAIGVRTTTAYKKLSGSIKLSCQEAKAIKEKLFPNLSIEYLFAE